MAKRGFMAGQNRTFPSFYHGENGKTRRKCAARNRGLARRDGGTDTEQSIADGRSAIPVSETPGKRIGRFRFSVLSPPEQGEKPLNSFHGSGHGADGAAFSVPEGGRAVLSAKNHRSESPLA